MHSIKSTKIGVATHAWYQPVWCDVTVGVAWAWIDHPSMFYNIAVLHGVETTLEKMRLAPPDNVFSVCSKSV